MKDREIMNKFLPYIVVAILLGTVTMVVPYALLESRDYTSMIEGDTLSQSSPAETEQPYTPTESSTPMPNPEPVPSPVPSTALTPTPEPSTETTKTEIPNSQEQAFVEGGDFSSGDSLTPSPSAPTGSPTPQVVPSPFPSQDPSPFSDTLEPEPLQSAEPALDKTDSPLAPQPAFDGKDLIAKSFSHLPSMGLMIVPSFLIALGVFIYIKKRSS